MGNVFRTGRMFSDPAHQNICQSVQFSFCQLPSGRDTVPLLQTAPTANPRGMLGNKTGVSTHGSLLAVVRRKCRSQPGTEKLTALESDFIHSPFGNDFQLRFFQTES